jgi:hypothetical protein
LNPRFCCKCGAELRPQSKFCKICGEPVQVRKDPEDTLPADRTVEEIHASVTPAITFLKDNISVPEEKQNASPVKIDSHAVNTAGNSDAVPCKRKSAPACCRSVWKVVLAAVLCILIFVWSLGAVMLADIQISLSPEKIDATLGSVLNASVLMEIPAGWFFPDTAGRSQTVVEWLLDEIEKAYDNSMDITTEIAEAFLHDSTFLPFMIRELGDCILDLRNGTGQSGISVSEIQSFIEDNRSQIEQLSGEKLEAGEIEIIAESLENQGLLEALEVQNLRFASPTVFNITKLGLSYWGIGVFCMLSLLFVVLLAKVNGWNLWHTSGDVGVVLVVIGSVLLCATAFTTWLPDIWFYACGTNDLLANLTGVVLQHCLLIHTVVLAVGTVLCAIKMIWRKICQRRVLC